MDFGYFIGHKKTSADLLNKIKNISKNPGQLIDNLQALNIFQSVTHEVSKRSQSSVVLKEAFNSVRMRIDSSGKRTAAISFPNLYGNGEYVKVDYNGLRNCMLTAGMPGFINNRLVHYKLVTSSKTHEYDNRKIPVSKVSLEASSKGKSAGIGVERMRKLTVYFGTMGLEMLGAKLTAKYGVTQEDTNDKYSPFAKVAVVKPFSVEIGRFFGNATFSIGRLFGPTSLTEKFFLGSDIRGYLPMSITPVSHNKKTGANSYAGLRSEVGARLGPLRAFAFADAGVCSVRGISECYETVIRGSDTNCIGKSVGCGISLNDKKGISFIYSIPLTNNTETERYSVGLDFNF